MLQLLVRVSVAAFLCLAASWQATAQEAGELPPILLTRQLMDARGLKVGDSVRLATDPAGKKSRVFRITGMYEPDADPMRFAQARHEARVHLPDLVALEADPADPGASETITAINVALQQPGKTRGRDADREQEIAERMARAAPELGPDRVARIVHAIITESLDAVSTPPEE